VQENAALTAAKGLAPTPACRLPHDIRATPRSSLDRETPTGVDAIPFAQLWRAVTDDRVLVWTEPFACFSALALRDGGVFVADAIPSPASSTWRAVR